MSPDCPRLKKLVGDSVVFTEEGRRLISKVKPTRRVRETEEGYCTIFGDAVIFLRDWEPGAKKCVKITEYEIEDDSV